MRADAASQLMRLNFRGRVVAAAIDIACMYGIEYRCVDGCSLCP